jgi:hypothetical protein
VINTGTKSTETTSLDKKYGTGILSVSQIRYSLLAVYPDPVFKPNADPNPDSDRYPGEVLTIFSQRQLKQLE